MKTKILIMLRSLILLSVITLGWNKSALAQTTFPVPNILGVCGISGVIVTMSGGSGGASNSSGTGFPDGGAGGNGGSVICTLNVATPVVITSLTYYVGMAGADGVPVYTGTTGAAGGTGYGTGGNGGSFAGPSGIVGTDVSGGAGGGSSAVLNTTGSTALLVAGGGGGGGALSFTVTGGNAGNPGAAGGSYAPNYGGSGGTAGSFGATGGAGIAYAGSPAAAAAPGNGGNGGEGLTGSQSGGGGGAGYGGGAGGGAGNTTTAGVNTVTGGGGGGSNYVNPAAVTTGLINGTASTTGDGAVSLVLYPAIASTTGVVLCVGGTSTFTESTPAGVWSSSDPSIATVSAATGSSITVTGVSVGTVNISYTASAGYWSFVTVTVHAGVSPIAGPASVCVTQTINLSDTAMGGTWTTSDPTVATISATGVVTGVSAGTAMITYTVPAGCNTTTLITVTPFPAPIGGTLSVCVGNTTALNDAVPAGTWSSLYPSIATVDPTSGLVSGISAGTSTITYGFTGGCTITADVTVNPLPVITSVQSTNPATCSGTDGTITLDGLTPGTSYSVNYVYNGTTAPVLNITANSSHQVGINIPSAGLLSAGTYTNIYVTDPATGCVSLPVGPVTLSDPPSPPPPVITSQPVCDHQTLFLTATDAVAGGTYSWTGPNGFTSTIESPDIVDATYANAGMYTVIYTIQNCTSTGTGNVMIETPAPLTGVTPSQTIAYGSTIRLDAGGAYLYTWAPDNGTLSNPNINNPFATPIATTTYTVYGMTPFGCRDSAFVTLTIDSVSNIVIPTAFTPNGDGRNDVFHVVGLTFQRIVEFRIFNRWGQQVFYSNNAANGWDGTFNGEPQEMGIYSYQIIVAQPTSATENLTYKGTVTLIR